MAVAAPYLMIAAAAMSAYGSVKQGQDQVAAANANAANDRQAAQTITDQANAEAAIQKQQTTRQMGEIAADYSAAGVDPTQGSPLSVMSDQAMQGELTRRLTLYRGNVMAAQKLNDGNLSIFSGAVDQQKADNQAATTLLSGAASYGKNGGWMPTIGGGTSGGVMSSNAFGPGAYGPAWN